jgi:hypothetical protein
VTGTDGTCVSPAPSRDVCVRAVSRRVGRLAPVERAEPNGTRPSRVVPDRPVTPLGPSTATGEAKFVSAVLDPAEAAGANPQTSQ